MQKVYLVIAKKNIYIYKKEGDSFERIYIDGNSEYEYSVNAITAGIEKLKEKLVDEYNLDTQEGLNFTVIENEDKSITQAVENVLGQCIHKKYALEKLMTDILKQLCMDKKLLISEYGINFDGKNYLIIRDKIMQKEFSLLGYTLCPDKLVEYIKD